MPQFLAPRWWQSVLHNQTAFLIRMALLFRRGIVVTDVPYRLKIRPEQNDERSGAND
ncbi:MAG: hypothetical protein HY784_02495 [Chloroflexi bacterium]|nr:hypothetical protein [Chloroflexota bacterium]